ncbi:carbonic anhydrase 15-like [Engraulis encrasicolus]|uniref:carbonic anhydrase 15-like n=1 Tax=Engraulis encrasicolus TaxID=184585 RepID=UPI002FD2625A
MDKSINAGLHVVHIKEEYGTLEEAELDREGIAVLAFFFEESVEDNPHIDTVLHALRRVRFHGNTSSVANFKMSYLIPPAHELTAYYRYTGSVTTPGCNEAVIWTIFQRTLPASHRQLVEVASEVWYWTGKPMHEIFRPLQPLNGRIVYKSLPSSSHMMLPLMPSSHVTALPAAAQPILHSSLTLLSLCSVLVTTVNHRG